MVELKVSGITIIAIVLSSMLAKFYGVLLVCEINIVSEDSWCVAGHCKTNWSG